MIVNTKLAVGSLLLSLARTAQCHIEFTTASCGFSATAWLSCIHQRRFRMLKLHTAGHSQKDQNHSKSHGERWLRIRRGYLTALVNVTIRLKCSYQRPLYDSPDTRLIQITRLAVDMKFPIHIHIHISTHGLHYSLSMAYMYKKLSYRTQTARQLPTWRGLSPPVHSPSPSGYTPVRTVESETRNKRTPSVPSVKRTLGWIGHSRSFKVILICANRNPERCIVVMSN